MFVAAHILVRHVVPVDQLTWFACCGQVTAVDTDLGTITLTVTRGTRAVHDAVGGSLTLATTATSVLRTLADGAVTTVSLSDLTVGEQIAATGSIDRTDPSTPVFDLGHGFVWRRRSRKSDAPGPGPPSRNNGTRGGGRGRQAVPAPVLSCAALAGDPSACVAGDPRPATRATLRPAT